MVSRAAAVALLCAAIGGLTVGVPRAAAQEEPPVPEPGADAAEASAPGDAPAPDSPVAAAAAVAATRSTLARAFERLAVHDWEGAVPAFREVADALEPHALLGGLRDQCLYNVACAQARLGRAEDAVRAFAESVEYGIRPLVTPVADGRVVLSPGLSFAHILADPDLDSLRDRSDFQDVLRPLLRAGEPLVELTAAAASAEIAPESLPGVIVALAEDQYVERGAAYWREALAEVPAVLAFVAGPVRPTPRSRRWLLVDGDERFAVAKIEEALAALRTDERVDASRVFMASLSPAAAQSAFAAALASPRAIAGLALGPFRFHAAWHADALHALRAVRGDAPWRIAYVAVDERLALALTAAGVAATRVEPPPPVVAPNARGAALRESLILALTRLLR